MNAATRKKRIAIFASGSGSNAQKIIEYFKGSQTAEVACVLSNKPDAYVLERARIFNIPAISFTRDEFYNSSLIADYLKEKKIDLVVLAGFLWLVPAYLIDLYPRRIINIHPALLPNYGGKGMYGMLVHKKVIENNEPHSGITIHYANHLFDEGEIIFQEKCNITKEDTPETLAEKIHKIEHEFYPKVIEKIIKNL